MKSNVLLLCVDDMNDWAGCLGGYPGFSTPNIDRLAERGTLFTNAHCPSSVCNPSRTAILTGMRPSRSGVYDNQQWWRPAHPAVVTLPERFRCAGFETAGAGKIFHHTDGFNPPDQWDQYFRQVFDDPWDRGAHHDVATAPTPPDHPLNGITPYEHEFDWGVLALPESEYGDVRAADWAVGFLQRRADAAAKGKPERPFLLACGLFRPHLPCYAPQRYFDRYPLERIRLPDLMDSDLEMLPPVGAELAAKRRNRYQKVIDHDRWAEAVQAYLATISFADAQIGRVLDALDDSGLAGNTVVVFYSDNGFHLGEKRHWHKSTLWERATHVPFVIAGPGLGTPGQRIDRPVSLQDLYPTLVDLCGLPVADSERIDGDSLAPLIADPDRMWREAALTTYLRGNHALRTERWRYIRYHDGGEELYDRDADPTEERNLAARPEMRPLITDLRAEFPASDAPNAPLKSDWSFDHDSYTWRPA